MVSSSQSLLSGLDPDAPSKLSQTSFVARVPVSNSPARPTTGPDGAGLTPEGGLAFHEGVPPPDPPVPAALPALPPLPAAAPAVPPLPPLPPEPPLPELPPTPLLPALPPTPSLPELPPTPSLPEAPPL